MTNAHKQACAHTYIRTYVVLCTNNFSVQCTMFSHQLLLVAVTKCTQTNDYMHTYTYSYLYAHMPTQLHVQMHIQLYAHMPTQLHVQMHIQLYAHMPTQLHVQMHIQLYAHMHIQLHVQMQSARYFIALSCDTASWSSTSASTLLFQYGQHVLGWTGTHHIWRWGRGLCRGLE